MVQLSKQSGLRLLDKLLWPVLLLVLIACGGQAAVVTPPSSATPELAPSPTPESAIDYSELEQSVTPEGYQVLGRADAPVTMVMYSDFLCSACAYHVETVEPDIIQNYVQPGNVKLVYRHLAQIGPDSFIIAEASECAADQDRFWEMRVAIYDRLQAFYTEDVRTELITLATHLGLDQTLFEGCLDAQTHQAMVEADFAAATADGVRSRPVFDIGTERLVGTLPYNSFQEVLDANIEDQ